MREIKLRAWDYECDEMIRVGDIAWNSNSFNTKWYAYGSQPHFYDTNGKVHLNEDCIFMQNTGKLDVDNNEVYEGDIIYLFGDDEIMSYPGIIVWKDYGFRIEMIESEHYIIKEDLRHYDVKILGNIYENQVDEVLKQWYNN